MIRPIDLLRQGRKDELWLMCCGFIDLSLDQFMAIQNRLLLEQLRLLRTSRIGTKVMRGAMPETVEEFRKEAPFTTYADYCPELQERREYVLPAKPARWIRTSGYSGTYDIKWVPWSARFEAEAEKACAACALFSISRYRGDLSKAREHLKVLYTVGGPEYASGAAGELTRRAFNFDFLPSNADGMSFTDRVKAGFAQALDEGLDAFGGLPSVLAMVGDQMQEQQGKPDLRFLVGHPKAAFRLAKGMAKSKLARRPMLPKDLWNLKAIIGGGTDAAVFKSKVEKMWGRKPLEMYGGTEGGAYATQTWDCAGMTFFPNLNFLEFIPEDEHFKWQRDRSYIPRTLLLDELKPNQNYELVITNFHGGALTRFRIGDMIRIVSLRNEQSRINLPQMVFYGRADYVIDIAGLGRLTERIIWEALENTTVPYVDWTARKEIIEDRAVLHLYLEPRHVDGLAEQDLARAFARELQKLEKQYHHNPYNIYDSDSGAAVEANLRQIEVTLLPQGAFANYIARRQAEGADLGHLKPPHINATDQTLAMLAPQLSRGRGLTPSPAR
ncbi:MAG: GH3 auxin-responsive promoter family protein [Dehalococcoidia bacterium]|nr:GH3 auxin-responsive promoter family protein [Dehalococcoidia bacterium]